MTASKEISLGELHETIVLFARQIFLPEKISVNALCLAENILITPQNASHILTIMQEAIDNVYKHAYCTEFCFLLDNQLIKIGDNGKGFNVHLAKLGQGIPVMQQTALALGATFQILSEPNSGTKIEIKLGE